MIAMASAALADMFGWRVGVSVWWVVSGALKLALPVSATQALHLRASPLDSWFLLYEADGTSLRHREHSFVVAPGDRRARFCFVGGCAGTGAGAGAGEVAGVGAEFFLVVALAVSRGDVQHGAKPPLAFFGIVNAMGELGAYAKVQDSEHAAIILY